MQGGTRLGMDAMGAFREVVEFWVCGIMICTDDDDRWVAAMNKSTHSPSSLSRTRAVSWYTFPRCLRLSQAEKRKRKRLQWRETRLRSFWKASESGRP